MNFEIIKSFEEYGFIVAYCNEMEADVVCVVENKNISTVYLIAPWEKELLKNDDEKFLELAKNILSLNSSERIISKSNDNTANNVKEDSRFLEYRNKIFDKYIKSDCAKEISELLSSENLCIAVFEGTENVFINNNGSALMFSSEESARLVLEDYSSKGIILELREYGLSMLNSKEEKSLYSELYNLGIETILYTNSELKQKLIKTEHILTDENYKSVRTEELTGNPKIDFALINIWQTISLGENNVLDDETVEKVVGFWIDAMYLLVYDAKFLMPFEKSGTEDFSLPFLMTRDGGKYLPVFTSWSTNSYDRRKYTFASVAYEQLFEIVNKSSLSGIIINHGIKCHYKFPLSELEKIKERVEERKNKRIHEIENTDENGYAETFSSGELSIGINKNSNEYMMKYPVLLPEEHFEYKVISENEYETAMEGTKSLMKLYRKYAK